MSSSIKTFYSIGLSILLIVPSKLAEARQKHLTGHPTSICREPLNQLRALLTYYRRLVDQKNESRAERSDQSYYGECDYFLFAADPSSEAGDEDLRLDLSQTVGQILEKLEKLIVNLTCPVAVYFWMLADKFISFCQRVANACLVYTDFGCYVLTYVTCRDPEAEYLRESQKADVQTLLDRHSKKLSLDLATLAGNERL